MHSVAHFLWSIKDSVLNDLFLDSASGQEEMWINCPERLHPADIVLNNTWMGSFLLSVRQIHYSLSHTCKIVLHLENEGIIMSLSSDPGNRVDPPFPLLGMNLAISFAE